ncbi:disulfide bond formation protein B [Thiorhodovibrio frisius]|uniref:Disulfide bond formation protein DsbB n=1 Tax=Thiorhodovibrio frisius TaxID=631362 RepID=H8Z7E0_9GAMM|nr:disulfide bond formation protein B [Thiorhodovibrio frisius]EIC19856.1 disulfide bond formation protein DsbB [Thiorhodovibrio frisius]WPL20584.1 Disulfide oxidoreductase [Thiorhodovibrio frisius]
MIRLDPRPLWILLALIAAITALASLVLAPWLNLEPCHLCIFQRTLFMLMALLAALTAALSHPDWRRFVARASALLFLALAALGSGVAAYQSWLQWQPSEDVSCIGGQPGPIEQLVEWLGQQVPTLFLASGFCEDTELVILGLSLANMAFVLFVAALATGAWALWRGWRPSHS